MPKIAINGFGRIGRPVCKIILEKFPELEIVAINDLTDTKTLAHLLQYDTSYGSYDKKVEASDGLLVIGNQKIKVLAEKDPAALPWKELGIDVVLECTGLFTDRESASKHLQAGAKKVIISAPCKGEDIPMYVLGVNADKYDPEKDDLLSMASCTTNCLAPVVKVLNDEFGVVKGFMTTAHSYTSDQRLQDAPHKDLRRARAAAENIVPTTTGAAKAVARVIPELAGHLDGFALRVPTPIVSIADFVAVLKKETSVPELNALFSKKAGEELAGILAVEENPLVSSDYKKNPHSSIVDLPSTMADGNLVKIIAWYDNEWGYSSRLAEMAKLIAEKI